MKKTSKISKLISSGLTALLILSCASIGTGAASPSGSTVKGNSAVIISTGKCAAAKCADINSLISRICKDGSCASLSGTLSTKKTDSCSGGSCVSQAGTQTAQKTKTCSGGSCGGSAQSGGNSKQSSTGSKQNTAQSASSSASDFNSAYEDEVIRLVNIERKKQGLSVLTKDSGAASAARVRAKEIVRSFSHTRPDGRSCFTAASETGVKYSSAGENIAYGYTSPAQVVKGWMDSDGHRKNILSSKFTKIGVGCYKSGGTLYWTQLFIG